ncbi:MAG: NAD-dependent epimerase/dehydratase family protein [Herbaspirillum sp.]
MERVLVIGANGQIGSELTAELARAHGASNVIAADIAPASKYDAARYQQLDVLDRPHIAQLVAEHNITQVYQLAAMLSATGEQATLKAWGLNMGGLINVLEVARERRHSATPLRVFWPSSIAVFGPGAPRVGTPQTTVQDPITMYGISKLAGERWCDYYHQQHGIDVRSIRYPGVISYRSPPGGGTTDYAISMLVAAASTDDYACYLKANTGLPMIYMPDALRATLELMAAPAERLRVHSSYNVAGISFDPRELAREIVKHRPQFVVRYEPNKLQKIADSWPRSIDDSVARADWGWRPAVELPQLVRDMLLHLVPPASAGEAQSGIQSVAKSA